ncbi:hypothetical protein [Glutamicibacter sp. MCAF14]
MLGDHGVAGAAGSEGLAQSGALAVESSEAVVNVDQINKDAQDLDSR